MIDLSGAEDSAARAKRRICMLGFWTFGVDSAAHIALFWRVLDGPPAGQAARL